MFLNILVLIFDIIKNISSSTSLKTSETHLLTDLDKNLHECSHYEDAYFWLKNVWPQRSLKVTKGHFTFFFNIDFLIIFITANSDGVSPDKASSKGYWTLLIMPVNLPGKVVIPVSLTFGKGPPPDLEWFERGIQQIVELLNYTTECGVKFTLKNVIMDLPAVCYVKCIVNFGASVTPCSICRKIIIYNIQFKILQIFF